MTFTVVIVGAGFSGTMTALQLLRQERRVPLRVVLIEKSGRFGPGLAYNTPSDQFRLNVRASVMGAWPDAPGDFLDWLRKRGFTGGGEEFVPRSWYGEYLQDLLATHRTRFPGDSLSFITGTVTNVHHTSYAGPFTVHVEGGQTLDADAVVVAAGILPRNTLDDVPAELFVLPHSAESYGDIEQLKKVLIVGSGLSAVDFILEAENRGFAGAYTVLSRHGYLPLAHEHHGAPETPLPRWTQESLAGLISEVRRTAKQFGSSQPVIEHLRPLLQEKWSSFSPRDRHRFLRHVRPIWDVHRHRIPEPISTTLKDLRRSGRLHLIKGRLRSINAADSGVRASIQPRGKAQQSVTERFDRAVLCAGPEFNIMKAEIPLFRNLTHHGLVTPGPLGLGVTPAGPGLVDAADRFHVIGPLQRENLWEITAVRELRVEAARVASAICRELESRAPTKGTGVANLEW